jgi:integrase/recombinase XerD
MDADTRMSDQSLILVTPGDLARPDLAALWTAHLALEVAAGQIEQATANNYRVALRRFVSWGSEARPERRIIQEWIAYLRGTYSPGTVNTWLHGLRAFFRWAMSEGYTASDPTAGIGALKVRGKTHRKDLLTNAEIKRLLSLSLPLRESAILHILAYTGCRTVELHRADLADVETVGDRLQIRVRGKGRADKDEVIFLAHPGAVELTLAYLNERGGTPGPLFLSKSNRSQNQRLALRWYRGFIKDAFQKARIIGTRKTTHSLRHTAITSAIRNGATVQDVQAMARHSSPTTTMIYYHRQTRVDNPAETFISYEKENT